MKKVALLLGVFAVSLFGTAQTVSVELTPEQYKKIKNRVIDEYDNYQADHRDWAFFSAYADDNAKLKKAPLGVMMGNSITEGWYNQDSAFFKKYNLVGRGISGQTSSQMLVRFRQDVINLKPKFCLIMAGINDIGLNNGQITLENILGNIQSMCELAKCNGIRPIICSVTPSNHIGWRPQVKEVSKKVTTLNAMLKAYAKKNKIQYIDYYSSLVGENGSYKKGYSNDDVHPVLDAYKVMENILIKDLKLK